MSTEVESEMGSAPDRGQGHSATLMTVLRFEAERRLPVTGVIAVVMVVSVAVFVWVAPDLTTNANVDDLTEALPPAIRALLGFETLGSLEGLMSGEFYTLAWVVGLGGYLAYSAAASVAGDLRTGRMDTLLAAPISRRSVLLGKYLALVVPITVPSVVVPLSIYVGSVVIGDPVSVTDLVALHLLALPYLLCWGAVGLLVGVVVRGGQRAGRVALGLVVGSWLLESAVVGSSVEWLGGVSPMRYFDPAAVLVAGTYDVAGAGLLLLVAVVCLLVGQREFAGRDL